MEQARLAKEKIASKLVIEIISRFHIETTVVLIIVTMEHNSLSQESIGHRNQMVTIPVIETEENIPRP